MNPSVRQARQLRQVAFDEFTLRIKFFTLGDGVEDAKPGLRVAPAGAHPLPPAVVAGQLKVVELLGKVALTPAPVHTQIFHQKTARYHAQTVVHVTALLKLQHGRVHQRVTGLSVFPSLKAL